MPRGCRFPAASLAADPRRCVPQAAAAAWHGGCRYPHHEAYEPSNVMPERGAAVAARLIGLTAPVVPDCGQCRHRDSLLAAGRCQPGDACVVAHSGRQIERFLRRNPEEAEACLGDPFWERRAIAVRYAPLAAVRVLVHDPDEVVRRAVATRLPAEELPGLLHDTDREVRVTVAARLPAAELQRMITDPDYMVRLQVARRLPHGALPRMALDPDREVRKEVARRLPAFALGRMAGDEDAEVRRIAAARMLPEDAAGLLADADWLVRLEAARVAPLPALAALADDPEADVRATARARLYGTPDREEAS